MTAGRALLLVCDFNGHGGTQTQVLELLAGIDRSRFSPHLATLRLDPALAARAAAAGVPPRDLALRGAWTPATIRAVRGLAAFIRENGVRLAHGFLLHGNIVAAAAARLAGVPYLTSVRNLDLSRSPLQALASRWAHARAAAVTFNSRHVRDLVARREAIPAGRARVIENGLTVAAPGIAGIEAARAAWPPGAAPRILCVASLFPKKGHPYLLAAFALLLRRHPGASLLLAGQGPDRAALERRAEGLGVAGRVVFAGYRADAPALLATADVLALASIEEGMPNVLLEAMAAGVPQVATSVGGVPETIEEGRTGHLVPPRDPALLAERIDRILSDPGLRARMAVASRERFAARFTAPRMVRAHEDLWDEMLGRAA